MATGLIAATADALLDALCDNASYTNTDLFIQLHTGDPGAAGTSNVATETTRQEASMGSASSGSIANDTAITWEDVATGDPDDYTHFSAWSQSSGGVCKFTGTVTANAVSDGDDFTFPIGAFTASFTVAS